MSTAIAALLLFAATAAAVSANGSTTAFELLDDGSVVVPVTIGGTGPYRFVIDTGSSRTVISTPAVAERCACRCWPKRWSSPRRAGTMAYIVRLDGLAIDGRPGVNVSAAVMPSDRYAAGQQVDGLIGQDLLAGARLHHRLRRARDRLASAGRTAARPPAAAQHPQQSAARQPRINTTAIRARSAWCPTAAAMPSCCSRTRKASCG